MIDYDKYGGSVLYHIQYEDGDQDYINETECRDEMDLYQKIEFKWNISEWELHGDEYCTDIVGIYLYQLQYEINSVI